MLSTCNLSAAQAENYFVKDDYYTEEAQHEASFWWGKGAGILGLTGTVEKAVFGKIRLRHPTQGSRPIRARLSR
ncbi:MAG: relaxase domain-containing protein [Phormidesmis sp. RL_2_1]|nr:relaxase domain-containing protein [Phormidesmis sp. RL_2_1]